MNKRQLVIILATLFALLMNYLANALPINGVTTGQVSDNIPSLFTPAGYVFSIWGIIYIGLIAFTVYQALPAQKNNPRFEKAGYWYALSGLLNGLWIVVWHYGFWLLSVLVMLGLLLSLIMVYIRGAIGKSQPAIAERLTFDIPFGIYLGWISVATIANISVLGLTSHWSGWGIAPQTWTILMMLAAVVLAAMMMLTRREIAYPLVIIWALFGISVARADIPLLNWTAQIFSGFLLAFLLVYLICTSRKKK